MVLLTRISFTVPHWPSITSISPTLMGLSNRRMRPLMKVIDDVLEAEADPHSQGPGHQEPG